MDACSEFRSEVVRCASNNLVQFLDDRSFQVMGAFGYSLTFVLNFSSDLLSSFVTFDIETQKS